MSSDRMIARHLTLAQAARAAGGWAWAERALYETVGNWVTTTRSAPAKVYFDSASQHHAWRAHLWEQQLAGRLVQAYGGPGPGVGDVTQPFSDAAGVLIKALSALEGDVERAAVHSRAVLTRAVCEYRWWEQRLSPASDRPLARVISFALADASTDWAEGASVLAGLLDDEPQEGPGAPPGGDGPAGRAAAACAEVDRLLAGQGLVFGG